MPSRSELARLQQGLVAVLGFLAMGALLLLWPRSAALAVAVAVAFAFVHAPFLALEFAMLRVASRSDPTPRPPLATTVVAWWREVVADLRVFGFRQPFAWQAEPDWLPADAMGRTGIVFIHGFLCNRGLWTPWLRQARAKGIPFAALNLEPVFGDIDGFAPIVERAVQRVTQATGRPPVLVCHSMGGLAARAWLRAFDGAGRVARVVTVATPHRGTWLARFSRVVPGRQMKVGNAWLTSLACGPEVARLFICWYSDCDNIVFPPLTATLDGADNRLLPGAAHVDLAFRPQVMAATWDLVAAL